MKWELVRSFYRQANGGKKAEEICSRSSSGLEEAIEYRSVWPQSRYTDLAENCRNLLQTWESLMGCNKNTDS